MRSDPGHVVFRPGVSFNAVKVFSATMLADRAVLGEKITNWLTDHRVQPVEMAVTQSSDSDFHCVAVTVFYRKE
ncbi:MAG TPA: hypothetical protein VGM88_24270 [Kofleriaceae bacterium]|jgi:hypothetical protein